MTAIKSHLILEPVGQRLWALRADFIVETDTMGRLVVPTGFVCDLNSIPRLWWAVSPVTDYPEAGTVHDWLYAQQAGKAQADRVYFELLRLLGMSAARAAARYSALRLFGGPAYRSHAPK